MLLIVFMSFSLVESKAYDLMFKQGKSANEVSEILSKEGNKLSSSQLRAFKNAVLTKMDLELRDEYLRESMLESFERTKIEFEDSVKRLKDWIQRLEVEGRMEEAMIANRDLTNQVALSLRVLGKLGNQMMSIRADNVNVMASPDFVEAFKRMQEQWFEKMDARIENDRLVFSNPSPELVDAYFRWKSLKERGIDADASSSRIEQS